MPVHSRTTKSGQVRYLVRVNHQGKPAFGGTHGTLRAAKAAEKALIARLDRDGDTERVTVSEFSERWQSTMLDHVRASTRETYRHAVKPFVNANGHRLLSSITRDEAHRWVTKAGQRGSRSPLRTLFSAAVRLDLIRSNPFANLGLPSAPGRRDLITLTEDEVQKLAAAARAVHGPQYGAEVAALILTAAYTGMRRGELVVLEWDDISFGDEEVRVTKTLSNDREVLPPKNSKPRTVVLPRPAADALRAVPRHLGRTRIFGSARGSLLTKSNWHYTWDPVRRAFGKPDYDFHELRHFTATHLLMLDVPQWLVAEQLGHSDGGQLVGRLYGHPDKQHVRSRIRAAFERDSNVIPLRNAQSDSDATGTTVGGAPVA